MAAQVAVLVLGFNAPLVLSRLSKILKPELFNIYAHIDKKVDLSAYKKDYDFQQCNFISERYEVYWGGYSMVQATLALANEALQNPLNQSFLLISDDSFPLLSGDRLIEELDRQPIRIDLFALPPDRRSRYENIYFLDSDLTSARYRDVEKRVVSAEAASAINRAIRLSNTGKRPVKLYGGSQWWALSRKLLLQCVTTLEHDTWLRESFEFSAVPDECLFPTLVMEADPELKEHGKSIMFADFKRNPKPYIFTHIGEISETSFGDRLFVRKVCGDEGLLEAMTERLTAMAAAEKL